MKKILLASAMIIFATHAMAGGFYISPKFGYTFAKTDDVRLTYTDSETPLGSDQDSTFHAGLAVGYDFVNKLHAPVRTELEYKYNFSADWDKSVEGVSGMTNVKAKAQFHALNANIYYDFRNSTNFTPFIGGGVGLAIVDSDVEASFVKFSKNKAKFTWNLQAGIDYKLNAHNTIGLGYRYSELGDTEVDNAMATFKTSHPAHEATLIYRYTF